MNTDEPTTDAAPFPQMHKLTKDEARAERDGYWWLILPDVPALFGGPFGGGGESRARVCLRCGALVGLADEHDAWHDSLAAAGDPGDGPEETR